MSQKATDRLVRSALPTQQLHKIDLDEAPNNELASDPEQYQIKFPAITSDFEVCYVEAEPGDELVAHDWHTHLPGFYQIIVNLEGKMVQHYEDADGNQKEVEVGPGEVLYNPGGLKNAVQVVGDETNVHLAMMPTLHNSRLDTLVGEDETFADGRQNKLEASFRYESATDQVLSKDEDSVTTYE